jgi:hypothetical protein
LVDKIAEFILDLRRIRGEVFLGAGMLDIGGDIGMTIDVVINLQAGVFAARGAAEDACELLGIDVERPREVVQVIG